MRLLGLVVVQLVLVIKVVTEFLHYLTTVHTLQFTPHRPLPSSRTTEIIEQKLRN